MVLLADTLLSAEVSQIVRHEQLISLKLTSPVTKKHSIDRLIGTESAESVTDWANSMVVMRFLPVLNTHRDLGFFHTTSFTNSCLWAS